MYARMMLHLTSELDAVNWPVLAEVFERAPLGTRDPYVLETLFRNSQAQCFAYVESRLVGAGRAIVESLIQQAGASNVLLHSVPGKEEFYGAMGFRKLRTSMARFPDNERAAELGYLD
jgi:hypothetical protein